ncbi:hypothetical protein PACID_24350 [Acidipropionibacterium acidipropionici ATCC 4875]|uniref:Uncharacterized protein n=1 Tax=Acidipropionibacterium acidipropionici (strain ATCC 4875 / DSM 20272 / JCM 6432 / NBRC 12425 / NCIMB 8070 / 4) TaxID=1171373 RepID=K7RUX5_ACIA4|nr:hypothetical protein PACID_24350 [Acidipropionibacterium acidipropionici ATCC 4875]
MGRVRDSLVTSGVRGLRRGLLLGIAGYLRSTAGGRGARPPAVLTR